MQLGRLLGGTLRILEPEGIWILLVKCPHGWRTRIPRFEESEWLLTEILLVVRADLGLEYKCFFFFFILVIEIGFTLIFKGKVLFSYACPLSLGMLELPKASWQGQWVLSEMPRPLVPTGRTESLCEDIKGSQLNLIFSIVLSTWVFPFPPCKKYFIVVYLLSCAGLFHDPMDCSPPGSSVHGIS